MHVAPHIEERDHGKALTDQRVVCIVPLRPLRIQPDPAVDDEVAELGE